VFLVELEKQVMQYHWSSPNIDAKQLHTAIIATNKETNADDYPSRLKPILLCLNEVALYAICILIAPVFTHF
jgi:hypothetical protein